MTRRLSPVALCAVVALLVAAAVASADPLGKTTLEETIRVGSGSAFPDLARGPGEKTVVRTNLAKPRKARARTRRTIQFFGAMGDQQISDEMSPARGELIDPAGDPYQSAHRPQEAWLIQNFDQLVRNMNRHRTSPIRQGNGKRARMQFMLNFGDLADSAQLNETRWALQVYNGGRVDPFSGTPITRENACDVPQATDEAIARVNADVAARRYTGVQDYDDWPGEPAEKYADFWDPDEPPPTGRGPYAAWPRYPGLLDRAQQPFTAEGVKVPWYGARGNHDVYWLGTFRAPAALVALTTGCIKPFPNDKFDASRYSKPNEARIVGDLQDPAFIQAQIEEAELVAPDPDRRFLYAGEWKRLHLRGDDNGHGFKYVSAKENKASKGNAAYYSFVRNGVRFMAIDTNSEAGVNDDGNIDDPQYRWIERELRAATRKDQLVVAYGHHPLRSQTLKVADENAPACDGPKSIQCDLDPRKSTPVHLGLKGKKSMRDLFLKYPHFIAFVSGHIHENEITPRRAKSGRSGFWEIATASEIDWPQQGRLMELMDNRDGTLSMFGTMVDTAAPVDGPDPGSPANVFTNTQLGSLSRRVAAADPQVGIRGSEEDHAEGRRTDRNVELLLKDPRRG